MFDPHVIEQITNVARKHNIEPAALLAVVYVESAGKPYAIVDDKKQPLIRWEGHYFDRLLSGAKRDRARRQGLASPRAGAVRNPRSQAKRWAMLRQAMRIDERAAIQSVSWGVGQVMGAHWQDLDYASPQHLMREAQSSVAGQVRLMVRFIVKNNLLDELNRKDWAGFARRYNGPAYRKNRYDTRMARAYERFSGNRSPSVGTVLRIGSSGQRVREVQELLRLAGHYDVIVDGDFGPITDRAVRQFQASRQLTVDGLVGDETLGALQLLRADPSMATGRVPMTQDPDVGKGLGVGVGGSAVIEGAKQEVNNLLWQGNMPNSIMTILTIISLALLVFGIGYTVYSIWSKRQTRHGNKRVKV